MATRRRHFEALPVLLMAVWSSALVVTTTDVGVQKYSKGTNGCFSPAPGYEVKNLTTGLWTITQKGQNCVGVDTLKGSQYNCTYTMAFCNSIANCTGGSVCVTTFNGTGKNETTSYVPGGYVANPFQVKGSSMLQGFIAKFPLGGNWTKSDKTVCNLSTIITFECDTTLWIPDTDSSTPVPREALQQIKFDEGKCLFQAKFKYAGACIGIMPAYRPSEGMTAGTVLIIIFFVSLTVYFVFGVLINLVRGFRGQDVIPHSEFWTTLPVLVADGCMFTFRCGNQEKTTTYDSI